MASLSLSPEQQKLFREFEEMGFKFPQILQAYQQCRGNQTAMTDYLIKLK